MPGPMILLADDEAHITCVVAQKLRTAGYAVTTARDGEEAFELACKVKPALIVTDLQMPRLSGLELALRLKQTPLTAGTPMLMLTARGYIMEQDALARTNIRQVLSKPFSAREILRLAMELIGAPAADAAPRAEAA